MEVARWHPVRTSPAHAHAAHAHAHTHAHAATWRVVRAARNGRDRPHWPRLSIDLGLLQALELPKVGGIMVVLLLHLLADSDQVPHTLDVVRVRMVDFLVELQGLRISTHAAVARRHHEPPLHLVRLDLRGPAEEGDGRLVHFLLDVIDTQPGDNVHVHGPVPIRLEVIVEGLRLVPSLVEEVGQACEHTWISWPALRGSDQEGEPLVRLFMVPELLVDITQLPHNLAVEVRDGMELVKRKQGFLVLSDVHINKPEVVDGLQAVSTDANRLKVDLLCALKFVIHEHAIAFVDQGAGIVAISLHSNVRVLLRLLVLCLQEVQEGEVG
mmetsp:Transcript_6683/g.17034  ORF Transcript_6683/g.17034 Transcript_6683/m.17034 type:complete len:326 (+) Transcript_6683:333-1310(+)